MLFIFKTKSKWHCHYLILLLTFVKLAFLRKISFYVIPLLSMKMLYNILCSMSVMHDISKKELKHKKMCFFYTT